MLDKVLVAALIALGLSANCTQPILDKCDKDIQKTYKECEEAAKQKGKNEIVDLECLQYFKNLQKDCWPCICRVAHDNNWPVRGCNTTSID